MDGKKFEEFKLEITNHIQVCDIVVSSSTEQLSEVKRVIDELIEKHKDFIQSKRIEQRLNSAVGVG